MKFRTVAASAGLALLLLPALEARAAPSMPLPGTDCTYLKSKPAGLDYPDRSIYPYFRDHYLSPRLPQDLGLQDGSERSWVVAILGLTMFTEARMENENSLAAAGATVLNRVNFGRASFQVGAIPYAAANHAYSQWPQACEAINAERRFLTQPPDTPDQRKQWEHGQADRDANRLILYDPVTYAGNRRHPDYPAKLRHAVQLADCLVTDSQAPQADRLQWVQAFGTLFVNPSKAGSADACKWHRDYLRVAGRSYCPFPASVEAPGWCAALPAAGQPVCPSKLLTQQHYELRQDHGAGKDGSMAALDGEVSAYVQSCLAKAAPLGPLRLRGASDQGAAEASGPQAGLR